jgi:hypothetical protein
VRLIALLAGLIASSSVAQDAFAAGCKDRTPTSWDVQAAPDSEPGGYEGYAPHVHFEIWGPRVRRQFTFANLRRASVTNTMRTPETWSPRFPEDPSGMTRPAYRGADGVLRCTRDLLVEVRPAP